MEPYYQEGVSDIDHRNVDAAGSEHPFGDEPKEWQADLRPLLRQIADDLYNSWEATVREYLANAETACLKVSKHLENPDDSPFDDVTVSDNYEPRITVVYDRSKKKLTIQDNGIGMAAVEVDQVFRHIGRSAARDFGEMSGSFGMGVLSFPKFIGTGETTMIMMSNSRLASDNAAYLISLAGIEPIRGSLGDSEYGTKFKLDQKDPDMDIRPAIRQYAEHMRVPVLYTEYDEDGTEVFNEDWGDKRLFDEYQTDVYGEAIVKDGFFEAYTSPDATGETLLLSMDIDRGSTPASTAPHDFDIRILDESGAVVHSKNGHEGLIPTTRPEYNQMLLNEREDSITESLLSNNDVTAYETTGDTYDYAIEETILESDQPLPRAEYVPLSEGDGELLGEEVVIIGPHEGRTVVSEDTWNDREEGRAGQFIPEDELTDDDICLPEPTTDRSSLQDNDAFWKWLDSRFAEMYEQKVEEYRELLKKSDDSMKALQEMNASTVSSMKEGLNAR